MPSRPGGQRDDDRPASRVAGELALGGAAAAAAMVQVLATDDLAVVLGAVATGLVVCCAAGAWWALRCVALGAAAVLAVCEGLALAPVLALALG